MPNRLGALFSEFDLYEIGQPLHALQQLNWIDCRRLRSFIFPPDRLAGDVPDEFTESDLIRRYGLPRGEVRDSLERLAREGWVERRPGYGWSFAPLLTSPQALSDSYRLRMALEPAGLREPSFRVDSNAFDIWRAKMRDVVCSGNACASARRCYDVGTTGPEGPR